MTERQRVVMVATSYPRFAGDTVGTFMEPIATGIAALGHDVHMVLPAHPLLRRPAVDRGVHFHPFEYAPLDRMHVFGYAGALKADVGLRFAAVAVAPGALVSGWMAARRVARRIGATLMHGHWVVPGGAIAAWAAGNRPLVVSLHGSDVYLAERQPLARAVAQRVLRRADAIVSCSDDLARRAVGLGASGALTETIPYGVDTNRFKPDAAGRSALRLQHGVSPDGEVVFAIGRFVRKKGFEYLIDAVARLAASRPRLVLVLAGWGDLEGELRARAASHGLADRVRFPGLVPHDAVPRWLAAADVIAVPSVRDDAGNVDGLPNVVLEALASGTPVVATGAGGIGAVVEHGRTGLLVPERDPAALAAGIERLLNAPREASEMAHAARADMERSAGWDTAVRRLDAAYGRAIAHRRGG